ncbi:hypothetical protein JBE04_02505 [Streptomyces sp. PRKS01-29]|nr:hypothetical protein [Streptomyces sabulosicollis]
MIELAHLPWSPRACEDAFARNVWCVADDLMTYGAYDRAGIQVRSEDPTV